MYTGPARFACSVCRPPISKFREANRPPPGPEEEGPLGPVRFPVSKHWTRTVPLSIEPLPRLYAWFSAYTLDLDAFDVEVRGDTRIDLRLYV